MDDDDRYFDWKPTDLLPYTGIIDDDGTPVERLPYAHVGNDPFLNDLK